ncbi:MAG: PRC-barrel domain-containing protein [Candidatus Thorarchaeota archaeon]
MKKKNVVDSTGKKIGHISDLTFTFDEELKIAHFILAGTLWEEFLEAVHLKPDEDRIFNSSVIKKVDKHIHLDTTANSLVTTMDKEVDADGRASIMAGDGFLAEKLEAIGLKDDVDIIVPYNVITSIGETIQLSVSKDELDTTLDGILREKAKEIQEQRRAASSRDTTRKARVYPFWPYTP